MIVFYNHESEDKQHKIPTSVGRTLKEKISAILNYTANMNFLSECKLQKQVMPFALYRTKPIQRTHTYQERSEHNWFLDL